MQVAAARHRSHLGIQRDNRWVLYLKSRNFLRMLRVLEIDDTHRAGRIIGEIDIMTIDIGAVHAAANRGRVLREHLQMRGIGSVEEDDAVLAIGRSLPREDAYLLVRRGADVVNKPCVDL